MDASSQRLSLDDVTVETFAGAIGQAFEVVDDAGGVHPLTLEACEPGPPSPRPQEIRQPFSLTFRGTADEVLPQRIYTLRNEQLGTFPLFLVPIGRDQGGTRYEAVFG